MNFREPRSTLMLIGLCGLLAGGLLAAPLAGQQTKQDLLREKPQFQVQAAEQTEKIIIARFGRFG